MKPQLILSAVKYFLLCSQVDALLAATVKSVNNNDKLLKNNCIFCKDPRQNNERVSF